ncbi:hypothetical protein BHE74_00017658 [Ensete ventricosum]|nr:hypothetical protein BHE74_00017658 [Ensete ventricosum]
MISYYYCKTGWGGVGDGKVKRRASHGERVCWCRPVRLRRCASCSRRVSSLKLCGELENSMEAGKHSVHCNSSVFPHSHIGTKAKRSPKVLLAVLFGLLEGRISGEDDAEDGQIVQESPPLDELSQLKQEPTTPSGLAGQVWQWDEDEAECFRLWPVMPPAGTIDSIMS